MSYDFCQPTKVREALAVVSEALLAKGLEPEEEDQGIVTAETLLSKNAQCAFLRERGVPIV